MEHPNRITFFDNANRILEEVLELPQKEREEFIAGSCGGDEELHAELRRLIRLMGEMDDSLDPPLRLTRSDLQPGDVIARRFTIVKKIGEGGMGSVFLADDDDLGQVALKTINIEQLGDPESIDQLRNEIRAARGVAHPNVCPVFDLIYFRRNGGPITAALTMKYLPGESLAERLARGALPLTEGLQIAKGIASGIDALHLDGVVHGDLKPANIILTTGRDGVERPVIADFGMARAESDSSPRPTCQTCGSPLYMAPERFRSAAVTKASDIYSFGLILFEMITGKRPFPDENLLAMVLRRVCDDPPAPGSVVQGIPISWNRALAHALHRVPESRPPSACAMITEIETSVITRELLPDVTVTQAVKARRHSCGHSRHYH